MKLKSINTELSASSSTSLLADISFLRLSGATHSSSGFFQHYCSAYKMWQEVWSDTFKQLEGKETIFSDDWTRQTVIHCLFYKEQCFASCFHRYVDFGNPATNADSYFQAWPQEAIEKLVSTGTDIDVCSNFTIHPMARKGKFDFSVKEVLVGLSIKELQNSKCHSMTGTMRVDKGMHKATYEVGAEVLRPNVIYHNVPVDLVAFRKDKSLVDHSRPSGLIIEELWSKSTAEPGLLVAA